MPKFKVDENLPAQVATALVDAGYDAVSVLDQGLGGGSDRALSEVCRSEQRAILSLDLDFADIRGYPPEDYSGIVVLRLASQDKASVMRVVNQLLPHLATEQLAGKLWIVDEHSIRVR